VRGEILSIGTQLSMKAPICRGKLLREIYLHLICNEICERIIKQCKDT